MRRYHVYIIFNPIKNEPFYVGWTDRERKGTSRTREEDHLFEARQHRNGFKINPKSNLHKINKINKIIREGYEPEFKIVFRSNSHLKVLSKEIELIKKYGRADLGLGPLTNLTDGGEGVVNESAESRKKRSEAKKGKPSPHRGKKWGPHTEERKRNMSKALKGKIPWNKGRTDLKPSWNSGLTKETDDRVKKYAKEKEGKIRPDMIGKKPWNYGKTKETDPRIKAMSEKTKGTAPPNKGKPSPNKGRTYEEIYGEEKAKELKELRRQKKLEYWRKKNIDICK